MSHVNMIIFLLLVFSLITEPAWGIEKIECGGEWVTFSCESPNNDSLPINSTGITKNDTDIQKEDNRVICLNTTEIENIFVNCTQNNLTADNYTQTTIDCGPSGSNPKFRPVYLCKKAGDFYCEDVLSLNTELYLESLNKNGFNISIIKETSEDQGIYWCVKHKHRDYWVSTKGHTPTGSENDSKDSKNEESFFSKSVSIITLCVCVVVLALLMAVLFHLKNSKRRNEAPPQDNKREEYVYEEIPTSAARKGMTAVYPTEDASAESLHYMTIDFEKSGSSSEPRPSTSHCEYSTAFSKSAEKCSINTAPSGEPLYANVRTHK